VKYIEEFQTKKAVLPLVNQLKKIVKKDRIYNFMEFCGGHTHTFFKTGLIDLLPPQINLVHGPGCPVCVLPAFPIQNSIQLLQRDPDIVLMTYADLMRIPTNDGDSLIKAKSRGLAIQSIYSALEALNFAKEQPHKKVVFLAIGFETTMPPTVMLLHQAIKENINNFYVYCNHLNTSMALKSILQNEKKETQKLDGLIGPGHVALITGSQFFAQFSDDYHKPIVISGFTPYDLAQSLVMLVEQVNRNIAQTEIQYSRAVNEAGNPLSLQLIDQYLENRATFQWRGLGEMPNSAFKLKDQYRQWDAEYIFQLKNSPLKDHPSCLCSKVLTAQRKPTECKLFGKSCTPERPLGPCMVSSEGACSAYYLAGRHLQNKAAL